MNYCQLVIFQQQRHLDLLTISSPENLRKPGKQKIVFVTSRVHPGESPASHIMQGKIQMFNVQNKCATQAF